MRVDISLLGGFAVSVDGVRLPDEAWSRRAPAALVKLLALSPGHRLRREQVIDLLWPELLVERAAPRLHKAAHYARSALGASDGLVLSSDTVALLPTAALVVDVVAFDAAVASARGDGGVGAAAEAVELYGGELLPEDAYEPWTEEDRDRLRLAYAEMLHVLGRWEALISADPLDEVAHLRLVQEHLHRGDRRAALRQLDAMDKVWQRELGEGLTATALALRDEAAALPVELAPVQSVRVRVPTPATRTVGRERDIQRVNELLDSERMLTLLGPGGVGKTRLAAEVALRRTDESACYVDLTKVGSPSLVPGLIARELGILVESQGDVVQALAEALRNRELLLILDNVEHVLEAAEIVPRLIERSPDLRVLTTSRARLRVPGEQVYDVAPLSVESSDVEGGRPDAIALFEQTARAIDPAFEVDRHLDDVVTICRAVDGLPLAIELAAGHVRTLSPPLLRARLNQRLGSPAGASRGTPERQQTVPAMIDWSLRLLGDDDRDLFVRLGVFHGPVPLEIVEEVCAQPGRDVVESLSRLVDHSLVRRIIDADGLPRFLLLELMRERSRELLVEDAELERAVRDRHAAYLADRLDDLDERRWGGASGTWIEEITVLLADIRAAHEWTVATGAFEVEARITADLGTYWHREGHHDEGRGWAVQAFAHVDELDPYLVGRLYLAHGFVEWGRDQREGRRLWQCAVDLFRPLGHERYLAYALALTSVTFIGDTDNLADAVAMCEEAIGLARRVGELPLLAQALNILGELTRVSGDDVRALAAYEEGLEVARAAGDRTHEAMFVGNLSFIAEHRGDYEEAWRLCVEAVRLSWALGRRLVLASTMAQMAGAGLGLGRPERGAVLMGASQEALRRLGVDPSPGDTPELDRVSAALRAELGEARLEELLVEGARLSLDEAVALALEDAEDPS
ncbi:AAA family ATPase [Marmoricola sp. URHB0036]|uniref:ATP-binding protein n=1 Tax=Marmoricola sp. URHB0036 TaxID=1298863 RepID=UPI0003F698D5|nr:AAA family ATPase [Marmoricola sp. URHB0036]